MHSWSESLTIISQITLVPVYIAVSKQMHCSSRYLSSLIICSCSYSFLVSCCSFFFSRNSVVLTLVLFLQQHRTEQTETIFHAFMMVHGCLLRSLEGRKPGNSVKITETRLTNLIELVLRTFSHEFVFSYASI